MKFCFLGGGGDLNEVSLMRRSNVRTYVRKDINEIFSLFHSPRFICFQPYWTYVLQMVERLK